MIRRRRVTLALAALLLIPPGFAAAADDAPASGACPAGDIAALAERSRSGTNPCVLGKGGLMLEAGYYQNASTYGGTALAAYPSAVIRYGVTSRLEASVAPATRIARSGTARGGVYTWSRSGAGLRYLLADRGRNALAVSAQYTPQSDETASISTRERFDFNLADRVTLGRRLALGAVLGDIAFTQSNAVGNQQSSLYARVALSRTVSPNVTISGIAGRDAHVAIDAEPQSKLVLAAQDRLSPNVVGDFEIGTALNPAGDTKAHYIGFGFAAKR